MDAATASRFMEGAGVDPALLRDAAATAAAAAAILWSAWVVRGLYAQWREGGIDGLALAMGTLRATVLLLLIVYFLQ